MSVARDEDAITQTSIEYAHAFQTLDPDAASSYFHVPCMVISAQGVHVMATPAEVQAFFNRMMDGLKARGYARSEIRSLHAKQVGESIAFKSCRRTRRPLGMVNGRPPHLLGSVMLRRPTQK